MKWFIPLVLVALSLYSISFCFGLQQLNEVRYYSPSWLLVANIVVCLVAGFLAARAVYRR